MENKCPGLVSRDFREGDFRGVCVWFGQGEEEDKVKSESVDTRRQSLKEKAERLESSITIGSA